MDQITTVMIIEDNKAFTKSLRDIIELTTGMECLGHYHSAETGLDALKGAATPKPDILLLDLNLPGESGLTMLPILKKESPETEIIILTQNNDYHTVLQAIHLGASGYLLKGGTIAAIRETIREVSDGATYIDPQLSRMVLTVLCRGDTPAENPLSPREIEALELLALGYSKKEAADMMDLSYHSVSTYVRNIFKKLEAPNIAAAIATAIRQGLI